MTRPIGYHALAARDYEHLAERWRRELARTRSEARRRWLQRQVDTCIERAAWHSEHARADAPMPPEVARHAAVAKHALQCARTTRGDQRLEWLERFRSAMRMAGAGLAKHLGDQRHGAAGRTNENAALEGRGANTHDDRDETEESQGSLGRLQ